MPILLKKKITGIPERAGHKNGEGVCLDDRESVNAQTTTTWLNVVLWKRQILCYNGFEVFKKLKKLKF